MAKQLQNIYIEMGRIKHAVSDVNSEQNALRQMLSHESDEYREEQEHLRSEKAHAVSLLIFRDQEIEKLHNEVQGLKSKVKELEKDKTILLKYMKNLQKNISALLKSNRWKMGKFMGDLKGRVLFRSHESLKEKDIQKIINDFQAWKESAGK